MSRQKLAFTKKEKTIDTGHCYTAAFIIVTTY